MPSVPTFRGSIRPPWSWENRGIWETTLLIEQPGGGEYGVGSFTFEVATPTAERSAGFVFLGVALVLMLGASYLVLQVRRNQRRRRLASGEPSA